MVSWVLKSTCRHYAQVGMNWNLLPVEVPLQVRDVLVSNVASKGHLEGK